MLIPCFFYTKVKPLARKNIGYLLNVTNIVREQVVYIILTIKQLYKKFIDPKNTRDMYFKGIVLVVIISIAFFAITINLKESSEEKDYQEDVFERYLDKVNQPQQLVAENIVNREHLLALYSQNHFELYWTKSYSPKELLKMVEDSRLHGLNPSDFNYEEIQEHVNLGLKSAQDYAILEALVCDAFISIANVLGNPHSEINLVDTTWFFKEPVRKINNLFNIESIKDALLSAEKPAQYKSLMKGLNYLFVLQSAGGWKTDLTASKTIDPGYEGEKIVKIRTRLAKSGSYYGSFNSLVYDKGLEDAVKEFQKRHGLEPDGRIGKSTIAELNVSIEERIDQVKVNLERWRWLGEPEEDTYVMVNIPSYRLSIIEEGLEVMNKKVIVGRPKRATPVFKGFMQYMVINPHWSIPPTILKEDVFPEASIDSTYLTSHDMYVMDFEGNPMEYKDVEWEFFTPETFPYIIRQSPSRTNSLGEMKFMFPNPYNIYIHDTPNKTLFSKEKRAFSSGCIRVEDPKDLVAYFLKLREDIDMEKIDTILLKKEEYEHKTISILGKTPVYITYFTSWVDENDHLYFYEDIYNRDKDYFNYVKYGKEIYSKL
ncbi:MAG: murein L,D-transpeptidase YcbB/YkuD [Sphingobacteriales bacterium]|jgi:murein L,D-transpeptidase YcbB/YkuD